MAETRAADFAPRKILVPIDFSASSYAALKAAQDLAEQFHAEIYLLHVVTMVPVTTGIEFPTTFYPAEEFLEGVMKEARQSLREMTSELSGAGIEAGFAVEVGVDVVSPVLMVTEREGADLLVISTHGMSGWHPFLFGSTAEKIVKLVPCPLLLLRSVKPLSGGSNAQS